MNSQSDDRSIAAPTLISDAAAADLVRLNKSYAECTGKPFSHFYCPFMGKDDPVELCMGHVVPQSYADCSRAKVAQRKDVDNFYGSVAEADFGTLLAAMGKHPHELMLDKRMMKDVRPRVVVEGEDVPYYPHQKGAVAEHTRVILDNESDSRKLDLVLSVGSATL